MVQFVTMLNNMLACLLNLSSHQEFTSVLITSQNLLNSVKEFYKL